MNTETSIINVVGTRPIPEVEEEYNKWYDEVHIPMVLKHPNVISVRRHQIVTKGDLPPHSCHKHNVNYGKYLTIYRFANAESYGNYANSQVRAEVKEDTQRRWKPAQLSVIMRAPYMVCRTWQGSKSNTSSHICILGLKIEGETLAEFNEWFANMLAPRIVKAPPVLRLSWHELVPGISGISTVGYLAPPEEGYPDFLVTIDLEGRAAVDAYGDCGNVSEIDKEINKLRKAVGVKVMACIAYEFMRKWSGNPV